MGESMVPTLPTLCKIVLYVLSEADEMHIKMRKLNDGGNYAAAGNRYPALVVGAWGHQSCNLRVFLDGPGDIWVTSRVEGTGPGTWRWPPRA
jgi:hypothetical protein